jgi:uncharacterized repeat protein (TIGR03837 family)
MDIDILCKVVDNYGDIGVAYRLARSLSELPDPPRLRLVVDDLSAFSALDPSIDPDADRQCVQGWEVFRWDGRQTGDAEARFRSRKPRVVIECFACGRPDWLEDIIFDPNTEEGCLIVDLEHLTAEAYAEEFHRMPSLTRSSLVRKAMFFPGFARSTGGLILDRSFARARERASGDAGREGLRRETLARLGTLASGEAAGAEDRFWICVFGYERDYSRIVADIAAFGGHGSRGESGPVLALVAAGKSQDCFLRAWTDAGRPFPLLALPFLPQERWDELVAASDFTIVRGEDSWSRAALSGRPFLWQAYPQAGRHHLIKVEAFLERLRPHFDATEFSALQALYLAFNDRERDGIEQRGGESLLPLLERYPAFLAGFRAFSSSLESKTDLAAGLVTFLREIV